MGKPMALARAIGDDRLMVRTFGLHRLVLNYDSKC